MRMIFSLFFLFDFFWLLSIKYTKCREKTNELRMVGWQWVGFGTLILSIFQFCHLDLDLPLNLSLTKTATLLLPLSMFCLIKIEWFWFYGCCYIIYESDDNAPPSGINIKENGKPVTGIRHTLYSLFGNIDERNYFFSVFTMKNEEYFYGFSFVVTVSQQSQTQEPDPDFDVVLLFIFLKSLAMAFQLWSKFINFTIYHSTDLVRKLVLWIFVWICCYFSLSIIDEVILTLVFRFHLF